MLDRVTSSISDRITSLVQSILKKRSIDRSIGRNDDLGDSGISSLDLVNLMLAIEAEFEIKIPDGDMTPSNFRTVARIDALVERLLAA